MAAVSVAVAPPIRASEWDQLSVPEGYRAEVVQGELVALMRTLIPVEQQAAVATSVVVRAARGG